jgi:pyruvate dehydrogenase E2 component (dihydrolipoamide acetyltransferase)
MPIEVLMPALSPTMTEGNLAKWHKKEGDEVRAGDVLAEIETDKATMEVEAVDEGTMGKILVPEGAQGVKVNEPIALLLGEGEDASALSGADGGTGQKKAAATPPPQQQQPAPQPTPAKTEAPPPPAAAAAPSPAAKSGNGADSGAAAGGGGRIFVSPLARRMAEQAGIDLGRISGSGPQGRIVKSDVEAAIKQGAGGAAAARPQPAAAAAPAAAQPGREPLPGTGTTAPMAAAPKSAAPGGQALTAEQVAVLAGRIPYEAIPHTGMRRTIARRMVESKQNVPHFQLTIDCELDALLKMRSELNAKSGEKISVNDFVIKAAALALRRVPEANASWAEDAVLRWKQVDISVAVALKDGLITPIIRNADQKGLGTIASEMKSLAARAKGEAHPPLGFEDFQGGTFSISNLGMYGIRHFNAVINPPQGCILAVGAGEQRPVVKNGALAIATVMSCTVACDHRVVDGATGARWIAEFKKIIEDPITMLL